MVIGRHEELQNFRTSGELSDICVTLNNTEFHLHKFPLFLNSEFFRALCRCEMTEKSRVELPHLPGGVNTFALIADYCYGLNIDIDTSNVVELRCAAEFLQMTSLATDADSAMENILISQPGSVSELITHVNVVGESALHINILSVCFETVVKLMKRGNVSPTLFRVLLEVPHIWFVQLVIGARDAGVKLSKVSSLACRYIESIMKNNMKEILGFLQRENALENEADGTKISAEEFGRLVDGILLEIPSNEALNNVMDSKLLCLLYRLAVQFHFKCEGALLTAVSTCICTIPHEVLVDVTTNDICNIIEHVINNRMTSSAMLTATVDQYLGRKVERKDITLEEFHAIVRAFPKSYREQHDSILLIAQELFACLEISEEVKSETLEALVDKYKLHEETLRRVSERNVIPSRFLITSTLAVASRLRNELIEAKEILREKGNETREFHSSVTDIIRGQWQHNDVMLNISPTDKRNTRVQFAKILPRENASGLTMEHEVYDGKLTLCVQSRATSTRSDAKKAKKFLFDPFDEKLIEITRSKHHNLMVGEHYERKKHKIPYWAFSEPSPFRH